ncbi:MAG: dTDP-4-dehydrorhamnose 3,5-epimerase family protein, partial [Muribaculaceae bacterium]
MKFTQASLPGVWIIDVERHGDSRGYFAETFRAGEFERHVGAVDFVQENESMSRRGVVRGLHYQAGSSAQAKLGLLYTYPTTRKSSERGNQYFGD